MKTNVYDMTGKQVGEVELSESIFGIEPNVSVMHDVVTVSYTHLTLPTKA